MAIHRLQLGQTESTPSEQAGQLWRDPTSGNTYIYVQTSATLTVGQVCFPLGDGILVNDALTTACAVDGTTLTATGIFTAATLAGSTAVGVSNGHLLRWFFDANATGYGQGGIITNRVSDDVVDIYVEAGATNALSPDGRIVTATGATNGFIIMCHTRVAVTTGVTDHPICVAQHAVTDEYWFWGLYKGGGYVNLDASGTALDAVNQLLLPAASGLCIGTTGTVAEDERESAFAHAYIDMAGTNDMLIYAKVDCERQWPAGDPPPPRNRRLQYPAWQFPRYGA